VRSQILAQSEAEQKDMDKQIEKERNQGKIEADTTQFGLA
jgi:hypothetical protein